MRGIEQVPRAPPLVPTGVYIVPSHSQSGLRMVREQLSCYHQRIAKDYGVGTYGANGHCYSRKYGQGMEME